MKSRFGFTRMAVATVLAFLMFVSPQIASAGERRDDRGYYGTSAYRQSYSYDRNSRYDNYDRYDNRYRDGGYYRDGYRGERSDGKSAAIIGGSAAAGAVVGGLSGGGKGAVVGAIVGGIGSLIFDRATKKEHRR